MIRNTVP